MLITEIVLKFGGTIRRRRILRATNGVFIFRNMHVVVERVVPEDLWKYDSGLHVSLFAIFQSVATKHRSQRTGHPCADQLIEIPRDLVAHLDGESRLS